MKLPSIKKSAWCLLAIIFTFIMVTNIILLQPYQNRVKTTVEPIEFIGTYQLEDQSEIEELNNKTGLETNNNKSVTFRGNLDRPLKAGTQILFFMEYMEVHIYLNNEEIYAWGMDDSHPSFMRSSGAVWGHCILPSDLTLADELVISLESKYNSNYNSAYHDFLDSLQIGDSGALARSILSQNWAYLLTGILLFLVGLTLQLFGLSLDNRGITIHPSIYYCAFFVLSASVWLLLDPVYSTLLLDNSALIMLLETVFMWLYSTFLCGYFGTFMHTKAKRANDFLLFGFVLTLVMFLVLQVMGVTDAYAVRSAHNFLLVIAVVAFAFIFRYEMKHSKNSEIRILTLPGLLYLVFGLVEMLNYELEWFQRGAALTIGFAIFILAQFVLTVRQIRNSLLMALQAVKLEKDLVETRTAVMLSQIQPHFLYNALTGIKYLCGVNPERAEEAMEHFSIFLRSNLDSLSDTQLITFDKEISHVKDYFYLEKMRFNNRVNLVLELEYCDFLLPPLTLQPLVENAIRYGITKKDKGGTVIIRSQKQDNQIIMTICDDGIGFDVNCPKQDERSHTGIDNVRSRIKMQCKGTLEITSEKDVGTEIKIILPIREDEL